MVINYLSIVVLLRVHHDHISYSKLMQATCTLLFLLVFISYLSFQAISSLVVYYLEGTHSLWLKSNSLESIFILSKHMKLRLFVLNSNPLFTFFIIQWIHTLKAHFLYFKVSCFDLIFIKIQIISKLLNVDVLRFNSISFGIN